MLSYDQIAAALDGIADHILILDCNFKTVLVNRKLIEFFEIEDPENLINSSCFQGIYHVDKICDDCPAKMTLETGEGVTVEKIVNNEILRYWTYPIYNDKNNIEVIVSCSRIITDQKKSEQELLRFDKLIGIGQLAAGLIHELNNPLCSIIGFAQLLKESNRYDDAGLELVGDIIDCAQQSKATVSGLLEYARSAPTESDFHCVVSIIEKALSMLMFSIKYNNIKVKREYQSGIPMVYVDYQDTLQTFLNIMTNAIDAMPDEGELLIKARKLDEMRMVVSVTDNGCGIAEENISNIFNPFFTTKKVGKGTGLGLSNVYSIMKKNGTIDVESEVGRGTTFTLTFPINIQKSVIEI